MPLSDRAVHDVLGAPSQRSRPPDSAIPISDPAAEAAVAVAAIAPAHRRHPHPRSRPVVVWFRGHDLRVHDHAALDAAVAANVPVVALYVLERGAETDGADSYMQRLSASSVSTLPIPSALSCDGPPEQPRPLSPNGGFALGRVQRWYLHHSLCQLRAQLDRLGVTLVLRRVDCAEDTAPHVVNVATALGATSVLWNKRYKPRAYPVDDAVRKGLRDCGIVSHDFCSETLMEPSLEHCGRYDDFQSYTRFWIDAMRVHPPPRPVPMLSPARVNGLSRAVVCAALTQFRRTVCEAQSQLQRAQQHPAHNRELPPTPAHGLMGEALPDVVHLELLKGLSVSGPDSPGDVSSIGCVAAQRALEKFLREGRFERFSLGDARRDGMVLGEDLATSRLSPHVRFGEISPRVLFYSVIDAGARANAQGNMSGLRAARTFVKNMSLREFGYYMLGRYPEAACKPIMPEFEVFPWARDENGALMHAWETGTTGFPIVDAAMRQLIREGWIHNRMRFLAASFFCKYLLLPWPVGAAHMVRTLVDGDEACNSLGWQWTAGCNSDSFPFSTLVNPLSLQNRTRSSKRAADYVRKYVPELACLPDSLIFTPWRATEEQRQRYNFSVVPRGDYADSNSKWSPSMALSESPYRLYPSRVVNGPDARLRARGAMEVMRRIFSAQRQCRRVITDQSIPLDEDAHDRQQDRPLINDRKTERPKVAVACLPAPLDLVGKMDLVSEITVESSGDSAACRPQRPVRQREPPVVAPHLAHVKRRRVSTNMPAIPRFTPKTVTLSQVSRTLSEVSRGEADLLLSSSQMACDQGRRRERRTHESSKISAESTKYLDVDRAHSPSVGSALKRPRPGGSSSQSQGADERLSVQSLLTSNHHPDVNPSANRQNVQGLARWNPPETYSTRDCLPEELPKLMPSPPPHSPHRSGGRSSMLARQVVPLPAESPRSRLKDVDGPAAHVRSTHRVTSSAVPLRAASTGVRDYQRADDQAYVKARPSSERGMVPPPMHRHPAVDVNGLHSSRHPSLSTVAPTPPVPDVFGMPLNGQKNTAGLHSPFLSTRGGDGGMFRHSVPHMSLAHDGFSQPHPRNSPMLMPYRHPGTSPPLPQMHQPNQLPHGNMPLGQVQTHDGSQRFFAVPTMGAHGPGPHDQPFVWYPAMSPYMGMQMPGMPGGPVPQMMHPMVAQHHGPYAVDYGGSERRPQLQSHESVSHVSGRQHVSVGANAGTRRGPSTPRERKEVARRMAAMDYYDEAHGGKHWEQWQAIALHLLDQYEFSEDTDRETSKAYVRLCVLKDELRDANPSGPRVTVNHCKEVFKILQLEVTGEWDRRGHGGVRGPYCYGCVKRSGVQISKK